MEKVIISLDGAKTAMAAAIEKMNVKREAVAKIDKAAKKQAKDQSQAVEDIQAQLDIVSAQQLTADTAKAVKKLIKRERELKDDLEAEKKVSLVLGENQANQLADALEGMLLEQRSAQTVYAALVEQYKMYTSQANIKQFQTELNEYTADLNDCYSLGVDLLKDYGIKQPQGISWRGISVAHLGLHTNLNEILR